MRSFGSSDPLPRLTQEGKDGLRTMTTITMPDPEGEGIVTYGPDNPPPSTARKYGITWADDDDTLFQTGYNYPTVEGAREDAKRVLVDGPDAISPTPDEMCTGGMERKPLFAYIEDEDDSIEEWYANDGTPVAYVINGKRRELFHTDDGIVPTCDVCDGPQLSEGDDWNGETGNHRSCEWSGSPDPADPDNYWIDDATGERVNAHTGAREAVRP